MTLKIQAGLQVCRFGKNSWVGHIRLQHQKVEIHSDDGDMVILSVDEFRQEIVDGDIRLLVPAGDGTLRPLSTNWHENERARARQERERRMKIIR